jgi:hypothetical protein
VGEEEVLNEGDTEMEVKEDLSAPVFQKKHEKPGERGSAARSLSKVSMEGNKHKEEDLSAAVCHNNMINRASVKVLLIF